MCKLFISLFLFLEYRFLVESPTKVAIKTEFSKLFPIFFPVNNHIIIRCSQINADLRPPLWVVAVANWFYEGGSKKPPYRKPIVKKKNRPKKLFKSEKKRNFANR